MTGADQWDFIRQHFQVDEVASYYAVNMCIQNWDGFFNNHYVYHDLGGSGKWEIYPWDEDKTWGDYDGASQRYDWYEMPLTYGMNGDRPPAANNVLGWFGFGGGFQGGTTWWRHPGYFSGPLLANPEFRKRFLTRVQELCMTVFTEEKFGPVIEALANRLEPEIAGRAQATGRNLSQELESFRQDIQSFHNQVKFRRKFLLQELAKVKAEQ